MVNFVCKVCNYEKEITSNFSCRRCSKYGVEILYDVIIAEEIKIMPFCLLFIDEKIHIFEFRGDWKEVILFSANELSVADVKKWIERLEIGSVFW